ncbi:MAG: hypothetical protein R3F29_13970 [Planctomycetota bacterium]
MTSLFSSRPVRTALVLALAASSAAAQSLMSQHGEVLIGCGDAAPGIPGATIFANANSAFGTPVLDANGTACFRARIDGAVTTLDNYVIYVGQGAGDLTAVARAGDEAPGLPGIFMRSNTSAASGPNTNVQISPFGEIVFFSTGLSDDGATVTTSNDSALIWGQAGGLLLLAREGDEVPFFGAGSGINWGAIPSMSRQYSSINASGMVVFNNPIAGGTVTTADDSVMVTGVPGGLMIAMREGDDAGLGGGETFVPVSGNNMSWSSQINENGQILIDGKLGGTATSSNDSFYGVYNPGGGVTIVMREGDQAPGFPAGTTLASGMGHSQGGWGASANNAFTWAITDGGVNITTDNDQVLYYGGMGGVSVVAQENDTIGAAMPGGERFGTFNNASVSNNDAGTIAFFCSLRDAAGVAIPNGADSAMFYGTAGNWTLVVREGDTLPIPASVNGPWVVNNVTGSTSLNSAGQLLFNQSAFDGTTNGTFYMIYDPIHGLQALVEGGESYTTSQGTDTGTYSYSTAGASNSGDGSPSWFNGNGDVVFRQGLNGGLLAALVRGHTGQFVAKPASFSIAAGGTQTFVVDAGPANAFNFYAIVGTQSGTRPGTVIPPLGLLNIPLNFDSWTAMSIDLFNTPVYSNTLWFTDANGQATGSFNLPAGLPLGLTQLHHAAVGLDINLMETFVTEAGALRLY